MCLIAGQLTGHQFCCATGQRCFLCCRLMGQALTFVTSPDELPEPPAALPRCPEVCTYSNAPWVSAACDTHSNHATAPSQHTPPPAPCPNTTSLLAPALLSVLRL